MIDTIQIIVFTADKSAPTVTKSAEADFADVAANSFAKSTDVTLMGILQDNFVKSCLATFIKTFSVMAVGLKWRK
jgi:hypothetical protein